MSWTSFSVATDSMTYSIVEMMKVFQCVGETGMHWEIFLQHLFLANDMKCPRVGKIDITSTNVHVQHQVLNVATCACAFNEWHVSSRHWPFCAQVKHDSDNLKSKHLGQMMLNKMTQIVGKQ